MKFIHSMTKMITIILLVNLLGFVETSHAQSCSGSSSASCPGFKTYTQGGWGSTPSGNNPGAFLNNNFATAFPSGLTIGCTNKLRLTTAASVRAFLPNGGTAAVLPAGTRTNPTKSSYKNVLAGQLVALALNMGFDNAIPSFGTSCANLSKLVIASGPFAGMTVQQLFDNANARIGGCTAFNKTLSEYVTAIDNVNKNYDNGEIKGTFLKCPPLVANCNPTNVTCFGYNNGTISVSVTSGTCPFTYSWKRINNSDDDDYDDNDENDDDDNDDDNDDDDETLGNASSISNLAPGTYIVTVKDAVGNTTTCTSTITEPTLLVVSDNHIDVKCYGGSDGSISVSFSGGTAPYTVAFNGGAAAAQNSPATYSSLSAGSYSWVVTDANGCTQSGADTIAQPTVLVASDDHADVKCNGGSDGSVSVSFSGGTAPYTVSFNGGEAAAQTSPASYSNLYAGSYSWVVTDANGCTQSGSEEVAQPTVLVASDDHADVKCNGGSDGSVSVSFSGGTAPYTVSFNGGEAAAQTSPASYSSLSAGTYSWVVTDANGCTQSGSEVVGEPTILEASDDHADVKCNGGNDGSVSVSFSGGTAPYTVSFNGGEATAQSSPASYSNLSAGSYSWVVTDANGCSQSGSEEVGQPTALEASDDHTDVNCNGGSDGSVSVSFSGGTAPYIVTFNSSVPTTPVVVENPGTTVVPKITILTTDGSVSIDGEITETTENTDNTDNTTATTVASPSVPQSVTSPITYSNLTAGSYSWTVTDANGCSQSGTEVVGQPEALVATDSHNDVNCNGGSTGNIEIAISGGTAPYTIDINGTSVVVAVSPAKIFNLSAGTYNWTVSDAHGCTESGSEVISEPSAISLAPSTHKDNNCSDNICDGSASVIATGGSGNYSYTWTINGTVSNTQTSASISSLCAETVLSVLITDGNGCTALSNLDTVTCIPRPIAVNDSVTITNGVLNSTLYTNDTPSPAGGNTWSLVNNPNNGTLTIQPNGTFTYTPNSGFSGKDTFLYKICDVNSVCDTAMVVINIPSTNGNCSPLRTYSQGGWGAPSNPAQQYMSANFASAFPNGITLGCDERKIKFTTSQAVTNWLPGGTSNYQLPEGTLTNPSNSTFNSNLVAQLLAATLSVSFDATDVNFAAGTNTLGNMYYKNAPFAGKTVNEIIAEANKLIGGCSTSYTRDQLQVALENINLNYDGTGVDLGYLTCQNPTTDDDDDSDDSDDDSDNDDENDNNDDCDDSSNTPVIARVSSSSSIEIGTAIYPNPASSFVNVSIIGKAGQTATISIIDINGKVIMTRQTVLNTAKSTYSLPVHSLTNQTYFVRIINGQEVNILKLVVKH